MPTPKKTPSGKYRIQYTAGYKMVPDGSDGMKKRYIYKSYTSEKTGKAGKLECLQYIAEGRQDNRLTVSEAVRLYIQSREYTASPSTLRGYYSLEHSAYTDIGALRIDRLTEPIMQTWVNTYSKDHSAKTVSNAYGLLTAAITFHGIRHNWRLKLPQKQNTKRYVPSDEDVRVLLDYVKGTEYEIIIGLAAFGTLRRSEIAGLTSDDVLPDQGLIRVRRTVVRGVDGVIRKESTKTTSSYRYVRIPEYLMKLIKNIDGPIVTTSIDAMTSQFPILVEKAGLPHFRLHDLRHYSASIMHAIGIPDRYIQDMGGWKSDRVLKEVYRNSISPERKRFDDVAVSHFDSIIGSNNNKN